MSLLTKRITDLTGLLNLGRPFYSQDIVEVRRDVRAVVWEVPWEWVE